MVDLLTFTQMLVRCGALPTLCTGNSKGPFYDWTSDPYLDPSYIVPEATLLFHNLTGVGFHCGFGGFMGFDIDSPFSRTPLDAIKRALGLPDDYQWDINTASYGFRVIVRCYEVAALEAALGTKSVYKVANALDCGQVEFHWRQGKQAVLAGKAKPRKNDPRCFVMPAIGEYRFLNGLPTEAPAVVSAAAILSAIRAVTVEPEHKPAPAPKTNKLDGQPSNLPARPKSVGTANTDKALISNPIKYLDRVIDRRVGEMRAAGEGGRNSTLLPTVTDIKIAYDEMADAMERAGLSTGDLTSLYENGVAAFKAAALATGLKEGEVNYHTDRAIRTAQPKAGAYPFTIHPRYIAAQTATARTGGDDMSSARTVDTATGEIRIATAQTSARAENRQIDEFNNLLDLPAPEVNPINDVNFTALADGGAWRGLPLAIWEYIRDYAPSRQRNALAETLDDVIAHVFQMGDRVVTAPKVYSDESDQRSFGRAIKDYGLGYLLQWPKNCLVVQSDSLKHKEPTNSCELSDCSPLPNSDHAADDTSPAVKPFYYDQSRLPRRLMQRFVLPSLAERLHFRGMLHTTLSAWTPHTRLEARQWRQAYRDSLNALEQAAYDDKIKALALAYLKAWRKLRSELDGFVRYWDRPAIKPTDAEIIALSALPNMTAEAIHRRLGIAASTVIRAEHRQGWIRPAPQVKQIVDPEHLNPDDDWKLHNGMLSSYMAYDENDKPLFDKPQKLRGRGRRQDAANLLRSGKADRLEVTVCGKTSAHEAVTHEDKIRLADLLEKEKKQSKGGHRETTPADTYRNGQTVRFIGSVVLEHAQRFGVDTVGKVPENIERVNNYVTARLVAPDVSVTQYTPSTESEVKPMYQQDESEPEQDAIPFKPQSSLEADMNPAPDPSFDLWQWVTPEQIADPVQLKAAYMAACNALVGRKFRAAITVDHRKQFAAAMDSTTETTEQNQVKHVRPVNWEEVERVKAGFARHAAQRQVNATAPLPIASGQD